METTRTTGHILPRHFSAAKCAVYLGFGRICEIRVLKMPKNLLGVRHFLGYRCRLSLPWSSHARGKRARLWFGHGCFGHGMLLEHERDYGLGMDALVIVCSWNTNEIMVWAWMLWSSYALGTRTRLCSGHRMLLEHERKFHLGVDALVIVCS